jgi:hypothetical protein
LSRRVVVTSVVRYAVPTAMRGWFRVVDLDTKRTRFETLVPESVWRRHDPNPRGGTRGARGVSVHGKRLVMAAAERLYVLDQSWQLVDEHTHRLRSTSGKPGGSRHFRSAATSTRPSTGSVLYPGASRFRSGLRARHMRSGSARRCRRA